MFLYLNFSMHTSYYEEGELVSDRARVRHRYLSSWHLWLDCVSLVPLEVIFLGLGYTPAWRLNRILAVSGWFCFVVSH